MFYYRMYFSFKKSKSNATQATGIPYIFEQTNYFEVLFNLQFSLKVLYFGRNFFPIKIYYWCKKFSNLG